MEIKDFNGYKIVTQHTFRNNELKVGSRWISSGGDIVTIKSIEWIDEKNVWVHYVPENSHKTFEKDSFSFQCRYCLIVE